MREDPAAAPADRGNSETDLAVDWQRLARQPTEAPDILQPIGAGEEAFAGRRAAAASDVPAPAEDPPNVDDVPQTEDCPQDGTIGMNDSNVGEGQPDVAGLTGKPAVHAGRAGAFGIGGLRVDKSVQFSAFGIEAG